MTFLEELCETLKQYDVSYAIVGGHAVALHGAVRGTVDIDFVVQWNIDNLKRAESALKALGLVSSLPVSSQSVFENRADYIQNRNLIAWNFHHPQNISKQVDIIINYDLVNADRQNVLAGGHQVCVLNRQQLIEMKRQSGRSQDFEDIKALESLE